MSFPMSSLMTNYFIWLKSMQNSFNLLLYMDGFISNKKSISSTFFKGILFSIIVIIILICYSLQLVRFISNKKSINSTFFKAILFSINVIIINLTCYSLQFQEGTGCNTSQSFIWYSVSIHIVFLSSIPASNSCKLNKLLTMEMVRGSGALRWVPGESWEVVPMLTSL